MRKHVLYVERNLLLPHLMSGEKTLEVRQPSWFMNSIRVGDELFFNLECTCIVKAIRRYKSFVDLVQTEDPSLVLPDSDATSLLQFLQKLWPVTSAGKCDRNGVLVFELELAT